jgi:hypothetical protein
MQDVLTCHKWRHGRAYLCVAETYLTNRLLSRRTKSKQHPQNTIIVRLAQQRIEPTSWGVSDFEKKTYACCFPCVLLDSRTYLLPTLCALGKQTTRRSPFQKVSILTPYLPAIRLFGGRKFCQDIEPVEDRRVDVARNTPFPASRLGEGSFSEVYVVHFTQTLQISRQNRLVGDTGRIYPGSRRGAAGLFPKPCSGTF